MSSVLFWQWGRRGGGPKYTVELARAFARLPVGAGAAMSLSRQAEIFDEAVASGVPVVPVDTYRDGRSAVAALPRLPGIRRAFKAELAARGVGTVVSTMSHVWNPLMVGAVRAGGARLVTVIHDAVTHPGDMFPFRHAMVAHELRYSDRVVTLTRHVADQVVRLYGYPAARMAVIPHGVFRFGPLHRRTAPVGRPFRFLFFGRLMAYKGLDLLLDALDLIDPAIPLELAVVGSGDPGPLTARLAATPRIRLDRRWIPEDEIAGIFDQADAVVSPYREASQSGVLATAYGAGLPMIATPVGGLAEQILPFGAGLVAADMSPAAFAACMTRMATDARLYQELADNTLDAVEGALSWDAIARRFAQVIGAI